jgi:hypothetical protein
MKNTRMGDYWQIDLITVRKKMWEWLGDDEYENYLWHEKQHLRYRNNRVKWPTNPPLFHYKSVPAGGPLDAPFPDYLIFIVSARLRVFFENHAPNTMRFFPVRVSGPGSDKLPQYFAVQFLHRWNCLHPYAWDEDEDGKYVAFPVIDQSLIPTNGLIGTVKHFDAQWLIRDDLKKKLLKENFTGFDFYQKASVYTDPRSTAFVHVNKPRDPRGSKGGALPKANRTSKKKPKKPNG